MHYILWIVLQSADLISACTDSILLSSAVSGCVSSTGSDVISVGSEVVKPAIDCVIFAVSVENSALTENSADFIVNS